MLPRNETSFSELTGTQGYATGDVFSKRSLVMVPMCVMHALGLGSKKERPVV